MREAAGVSAHHRPYDLRHTYASLMLAAGAPITFVASQLEHANPSTTLKHYAAFILGTGGRRVVRPAPESPPARLGSVLSWDFR